VGQARERLKVGLTGGLAAGKSTVARLLAAAGFTVIDADRLVAELYAPGEPGAAAVRGLFGSEALTPDGAVDRAALAARVFRDPAALARLEQAVHPLVRERFEEVASRAPGLVVIEATRLVEAGWAPGLDLLVTVEAAPELRLARAVARGMQPEEARRRLAAQGEGEQRRRAAGVTILNDGDLDALRRQVESLVRDLRARSGEEVSA
jgi:dephospho-CoA kinase